MTSSTSTSIRYINFFNQNRENFKTITHEELDNQDSEFFKQGFIEMLPENGLRRLYFDVELDKTDDYSEGYLTEVINWFDTIAKDLKTFYAACGYTINADIFKEYKDDKKMLTKLMLAFKTDESIKHMLSFHVIFDKVFDAKDIYEVFKDPKCVLVKPCVDLAVYKGDNKKQTFRHAFSIKRKSYNESIPTEIDFTNKDVVANVFEASDLCVTPNGSEAVGNIDELKKAFHYRSDEDVKARQAKMQAALLKRIEDNNKIDIGVVEPIADSEDVNKDVTPEDFETLLKDVCYEGFKRDQTLHDIVAFLPRSKQCFIDNYFLNAYTKLYDAVKHNTPENIEKLHDELKHCNGFCTCMSNIMNKYYEKKDYKKIQQALWHVKAEIPLSCDERELLENYNEFKQLHYKITEFYFKHYDYVHTTANEEKFLQRCNNSHKCTTNYYSKCYLRKILYICGKQYYYRKELYKTEKESLTDNAFKTSLKAIFNVNNIDERFNSKLKIFHSEDLLETHDGLVYPRYRDLDYDMCLTTDEFNTFITAYKSTFKDQCCADFAVKILIQDIASGFHDNSSIIKFYYGTGGNNKDCESCIYENIVCDHDLVFKTPNFYVLADEKNIKVVTSLYVQFNEMPANNKDRFDVFINALKNYNEQGKQTTRGLFENFTTVNTNIRFQCNTNNPALRDWLLDNANDAIKRRFFVAERVHSNQWSDWIYDFTHNKSKCKALKMYIKNHKAELYTEKLNSMSVLQFYKDNADIYVKYIEAKADDEFEELKEALCCSGCVKGKRDANSEDEFTVNIRDWYHEYDGENKKKCTESIFRSKVNQYIAYVKHCYVDGKRTANKYFITNNELIQALKDTEEEDKRIVIVG